jgi:hypothetical protein
MTKHRLPDQDALLGISVFEAIRRMEAKGSSERARRIALSINL